jgi:hypothetical protein
MVHGAFVICSPKQRPRGSCSPRLFYYAGVRVGLIQQRSARRHRQISGSGIVASIPAAIPVNNGTAPPRHSMMPELRSRRARLLADALRGRLRGVARPLNGLGRGLRARWFTFGQLIISRQRRACAANQPIRLFQNVGICRLFSRKKADHHERRAK